jgi:phosphatidylserine/phosphatidylglycerophosphate/cardiolipin synthase-like enzyme
MLRSSRLLLIGAILCALFLVAGCLKVTPAVPPTVPPSSEAGWYQVYFTTPKYPDKETDHHGGLDEKLTAFINSAKTSVDMASYQLDLSNVTQALIDAKQRGAMVRIAADISTLEDPKNNASYQKLQQAGIPIIGGNPNAIMHNKYVVVDRLAVWLGSWNFTENDAYRYNNDAVLIQSPELAKNYTVTFEKMFNDKKFGAQRKPGGTTPKLTIGGIAVASYFAPEDKVVEKIIPRIQAAAQTIDFMAFSFTDDDLGASVLDRANTGVQVRGVFENTGSETPYSEYGKMKKAGLDVWKDGNPYLMHHKVFIVDDKTVVLGSFNFSQNAETENDENLIIVDDASLAAQFEAEFGRVYDLAKNPPKK